MQNDKQKFKENFIKRLVKLAVAVLRFAEKLRSKRILWPIIDQLIKSATSVGANVVEAKASSSRRDYTKFFEIALKSANETKFWLIVIKESFPEFAQEAELLLKEVEEISKIIGSSVLTLKGKR